jgi:collagenase-like PrtC family protease
MLKLSVGYQDSEKFLFSDIVKTYASAVEEVYFAWIGEKSGRSAIGGYDGYFDYSLQKRLVEELKKIRALGVKLDLLFNANCYGEDAMSEVLRGRILSILEYLSQEGLLPETVTTASPAIAHILRESYPDIELRASVNMRIGSVKGMQYMAHLFDSFCVAKECNRDLSRLRALRSYADAEGKKLIMLANSGCMRDCSGQIFHDNMVAHEAEIAKQKNIDFLPYACWNYLKDPKNFPSVLQNTWILPEDIDRYEGLVDVVKLATRQHANPDMVMSAYERGAFEGNLLDLFEPGFSPAFFPAFIDNTAFPPDWFEKTSACARECTECGYCEKVLAECMKEL